MRIFIDFLKEFWLNLRRVIMENYVNWKALMFLCLVVVLMEKGN